MKKFFIVLFGILWMILIIAFTAGKMALIIAVTIVRMMLVIMTGGKVGGKY